MCKASDFIDGKSKKKRIFLLAESMEILDTLLMGTETWWLWETVERSMFL